MARALGRLNERIVRLLTRAAGPAVDQAVHEELFDVYTRERLYRREFFFNAFKALRFNGIDGDYAEFGCAGGMTFALAHAEARRRGHRAHLWAFDSFNGLPPPKSPEDEHPEWREGVLATSVDEFHQLCARNSIPRNEYTVVTGYYEETLERMSPDDEPTNIALAYIDCDLYSSTTEVLRFLEPRLKHGMIVAFDDYFCWSPSQISGERKALLELTGENERWNWTPYAQFGWSGNSFVIEDAELVEQHGARRNALLSAAAAIYLVSPYDAIPDFIPVIGHFDDAIVIALALAAMKRGWLKALRTRIYDVALRIRQARPEIARLIDATTTRLRPQPT